MNFTQLLRFVVLIVSLTALASCARMLNREQNMIVVETLRDLKHSACNSGTWFEYANSTKYLTKAPKTVKNNFKESVGVWFLQKSPFKRVNFDNQFPCMEHAASAVLYEKVEVTYFFSSDSSDFTVFDHSGENLLEFVRKTSKRKEDSDSLDWETLTIEPNSPKTLHGIMLTANITSGDYLLIDKITGYPLIAEQKNRRRAKSSS